MPFYAGRLGAAQRLETTDLTEIYTVPGTQYAIANVSITNMTADSVTIQLALSDDATPFDAEYLEWSTVITPRGVFERTGIMIQAGRKILVKCDTADAVNVTAYGIVQDVLGVSVEQGSPVEPA